MDFWIDFVIPVTAILAVFGAFSGLAELIGRINWNYLRDRRRLYVGKQLEKQYSPAELAQLRMLARHLKEMNPEIW